jgi:hypothetical protein
MFLFCFTGALFMADPFAQFSDSPSAPSSDAFPLVPHDTSPLASVTKAIYVGTGGHIVLRAVRSATDVIYRNVPAGSYLTIRATHVRATGTTAGDLVGEA